jgi:hypothetical protein
VKRGILKFETDCPQTGHAEIAVREGAVAGAVGRQRTIKTDILFAGAISIRNVHMGALRAARVPFNQLGPRLN